MSDSKQNSPWLAHRTAPGSAYAATLLGRLDARVLRRRYGPWIIVALFAGVLLVPSIQFLDKIHETKESEWRDRVSQRTAVGRWLPDARALQNGGAPYGEKHWFPAPPIVLIALVPFARLPLTLTAVVWALLKVAAVVTACALAVSAAWRKGIGVPLGVLLLAAVFSARPIIGDITHGNINIFVFLEVALAWYLFVNRYDWMAGVVIGLAVCTKVTPGLLVVYFLYKRSWRVVGGAGIGLLLFGGVLPSLIVGPARNLELLAEWYQLMVAPYLHHGYVTVTPINQSLPGTLLRILGYSGVLEVQALTSADHARTFGVVPGEMAAPATLAGSMLIRGANLAVIAALALLCRTRTENRRDVRLLLELSLVLVAMLLLSERTWKHHLTTLPLVYLATWLALTCYRWPRRLTQLALLGLGLQLVLLVLLKGNVAMFIGAITWGLVLCFVQNGVLLRMLQRRPEESPTLAAPQPRPAADPA